MNPVAFTIFGFDIRWYGIFISSALLMGSLVFLKIAKKHGYKEDDLYDIILFSIPAAIIGARLYYVIFNWNHYSGDIMKIINIRGGGMAIHGGLLAGFIMSYFITKKKNLDFFELVDIAAPLLPLGQAIGRWGNFTNGEAHGGVTDLPWAILVDGQKVHPTFLYESIWNVLLCIFLIWYSKRKKFKGELILIYLAIYSLGRFFIEGLRTDSLMLGSFRMAQVISIAFIIISIILWNIMYKKSKK